MSDETSARLGLALLVPGQAQKEMTHNEALATLDLLVQASVRQAGLATPPAMPEAGACWIVGEAPTAAWAGRAGAIAGWTASGWRFATPREGMLAWVADPGCLARYAGAAWTIDAPLGTPAGAIAPPAGGATVDVQARAAIAAMLGALERFGLVAAG